MDFTDEPALICDSIFYTFPNLKILQGVHLKAKLGNITGIFGRNGSGKSTLLKIASAQIQPDNGIVVIDGKRFHRNSQRKRFKKIAYLPQKSMLPKDVTVRYLINSFPGSSAYLKADAIFKKNLTSLISDLSEGELRYLEIMLILSLDRNYILLDEPYTGLSPILIDKINKRFVQLSLEGKGIIITDHYYQYMLPVVDEAYLMMNRQCYHLDNSIDFENQLANYGYLKSEK